MTNIDVEIIKNLRDGDLVWVRCSGDYDYDEMEAIREGFVSTIDADIIVLVTSKNTLDDIKVLSLSEMVRIRDNLDQAIKSRILNAEQIMVES